MVIARKPAFGATFQPTIRKLVLMFKFFWHPKYMVGPPEGNSLTGGWAPLCLDKIGFFISKKKSKQEKKNTAREDRWAPWPIQNCLLKPSQVLCMVTYLRSKCSFFSYFLCVVVQFTFGVKVMPTWISPR